MSLEQRMEAECVVCLVGDCQATAYLLQGNEGSSELPTGAATGTVAAVEHALAGGNIGLVPGTVGMVVVTLDPGKGPLASDELHDAVAETPIASTLGRDQERQLWYMAPKAIEPEGRWKHGRIVWKKGVVAPVRLVDVVTGISERDRRRHRPADLRRIPMHNA